MANTMKDGYGLKSLTHLFVCQSRCNKSLQDNEQETKHALVTKIMMEFERESEIMDLKEETISDTTDNPIRDVHDEEIC